MGKEFMGKLERNPNGALSRRGFLQSSAGLTFALTLPTALFARPAVALADDAAPAAVDDRDQRGQRGDVPSDE